VIYAMSKGRQDSRIKAAQTKGRQLGLILSFDAKVKEVTDPLFINYRSTGSITIVGTPIDCTTRLKGQADYLVCELERHPDMNFVCCDADFQRRDIMASPVEARHDLCKPIAVGVFSYPNNELSGYASNLIGTTGYGANDLPDSSTSGVSFRAQNPEEMRQWVLIHELGHYFGLTHVDGFDRLMTTGEEGQAEWLTWQALPNTFWHGGPRFIYTEAQRVWDFILTNFPAKCLAPTTGGDGGIIL
jgi:hypothetical protein